ncbi:MAG TPA: DUF5701 family protein [Nocardioides sp.]|uniref:DUF5701 family protein n=1 Tax=Nocardioides sp. TaxID=35761 RepID=UPI002D7F3D2E|nr:DUF5701 family protein [Nocardioides sp.]HET6651760.1 DUF5701 family protein [Nocardioides sp.]
MTQPATASRTSELDRELDRQLDTLLAKGYPALAGLDEERFIGQVETLRPLLARVDFGEQAALPFLVVVRHAVVPTVAAVERFEVKGRSGWTDMADEIDGYRPIEGVEVPQSPVYLLTDVSTGPETLNVRPADALPMIRAAGRTPLTVDEGVALVTQLPDSLTELNAFQVVGSRTGNKRIPSFWISKGAPRLGWCWEGNPHTWLGSASAAARLAP